jgi:hypothetical protein
VHRHAIEHTSHQWRGVDAMIQHERAVKFSFPHRSPKTGAVLPHGSLIPNHAAKAMISDFLDEARRHQAALDASMADEVKGAP